MTLLLVTVSVSICIALLGIVQAEIISLSTLMELEFDDYLRFKKDVAKPELRFASYYADNMVLQQAPKQAVVWGYANNIHTGSQVLVYLVREHDSSLEVVSTHSAKVHYSVTAGEKIWMTKLAATKHGGPYMVRVVYGTLQIAIRNVLFGDVWLCGGQSNMQFGVAGMFGASEEVEEAKKYPDIRIFNTWQVKSSTPLVDLKQIDLQWSLPTNRTLANGTWTHFSAVCWLFGKYLHKTLRYPIGLIESCWGGTPIEAWSSPKALKQCDIGRDGMIFSWKHSQLWNAMIHPLLNMTIYGVIWYQGEANAGAPNSYNCTFPAMIKDWREQFHIGTLSETDPSFPFGFVQLGPYHNNGSKIIAGFADIRWHQTSDVGYVPNENLPDVFMAVAMDDTDDTSPYGPIHPRGKALVGERLAKSGLAVAYGHRDIHFQGPFPSHYVYADDGRSLDIIYDSGRANLTLKKATGFEVCCCPVASPHCCLISGSTDWQSVEASFRSQQISRVLLRWDGCGGGMKLAGMRYAWRETPCAYQKCSVYDKDLPAAPYVIRTDFYPDGWGYELKHPN